MHRKSFFLALSLYSSVALSTLSTSCYYPDGTFSSFDSPCFPDQEQSICCGMGHTCMSNNLCRWPAANMPYPVAYIRGSCTDSSWNSTDCGNTCKSVFPSSYDPIVACPGAEFCCSLNSDDASDCCNLSNTPSNSLFALEAATSVTVIPKQSNFVSNPTTSFQSTLTSTPPSSSSTSSQSSPTSVGVSLTNSQSSSTSPVADSGDSGSHSNGMKIGVGVGVGAGALLILTFILMLLRFRRKKQITAVQHRDADVAEKSRWETGRHELLGETQGNMGNAKESENMRKEWHSVTGYSELDGANMPRELRG